MKAKKKDGKKTGGDKALAVAKAPAQTPMQALMAAAITKLALPVSKIDPDYQIPFVRREHIMWIQYRDKNAPGGFRSVPYVEHKGLVDALSSRGYLELTATALEPVQCIKAGCYGARETDWQQRAQAVVMLKTGQKVSLGGDCCRHNTTSMIAGSSDQRANAMARMAETRAMDRTMSRALNISVCAILELPELDLRKIAQVRKGDRVLATTNLGNIIEAEFKEATGVDVVAQAAAAGGGKAETVRTGGAAADLETGGNAAWREVSGKLHGAFGRLLLPVDAAHAYVHALTTRAYKRPVKSLKDLNATELGEVLKHVERLTAGQAETIKGWVGRGAKLEELP